MMSELNLDALAEEFNIDICDLDNQIPFDNEQQEVQSEPEIVEEKIDINDTDAILQNNLNKSNHILNSLIRQIANGEDNTPRMYEVAALLLSQITTIANSKVTKENLIDTLILKKEDINLKRRIFEVKEKQLPGSSTVNNNIICTDRESLIKLLKGNRDVIENHKIIGIGDN